MPCLSLVVVVVFGNYKVLLKTIYFNISHFKLYAKNRNISLLVKQEEINLKKDILKIFVIRRRKKKIKKLKKV